MLFMTPTKQKSAPVEPDDLANKEYVDKVAAAAAVGGIADVPGLQSKLDQLAAALAGKMPIAPNDGRQYEGKGATWVEAAAGSIGGGGGGGGGIPTQDTDNTIYFGSQEYIGNNPDGSPAYDYVIHPSTFPVTMPGSGWLYFFSGIIDTDSVGVTAQINGKIIAGGTGWYNGESLTINGHAVSAGDVFTVTNIQFYQNFNRPYCYFVPVKYV